MIGRGSSGPLLKNRAKKALVTMRGCEALDQKQPLQSGDYGHKNCITPRLKAE